VKKNKISISYIVFGKLENSDTYQDSECILAMTHQIHVSRWINDAVIAVAKAIKDHYI
jgi:hypothetical protein